MNAEAERANKTSLKYGTSIKSLVCLRKLNIREEASHQCFVKISKVITTKTKCIG